MKHLQSAEVRQMFLDFFKEKGHTVEPSASLVPHEDPTVFRQAQFTILCERACRKID